VSGGRGEDGRKRGYSRHCAFVADDPAATSLDAGPRWQHVGRVPRRLLPGVPTERSLLSRPLPPQHSNPNNHAAPALALADGIQGRRCQHRGLLGTNRRSSRSFHAEPIAPTALAMIEIATLPTRLTGSNAARSSRGRHLFSDSEPPEERLLQGMFATPCTPSRPQQRAFGTVARVSIHLPGNCREPSLTAKGPVECLCNHARAPERKTD
jgi:hypothetical protein